MAESEIMQQHCRGDNCLFKDDKGGRQQVRCIICCIWHHIECVSVEKKYMNLNWSCLECRQLTPMIKKLQGHIDDMTNNQAEMMRMLSVMSQRLDTEKEQRLHAEKELTAVKSQLTALSQQLDDNAKSLSEKMTNQRSCMIEHPEATPPTAPCAPPLPNLLIGTSLLRNADQTKLKNWEIKAKGGASIEDLHQELNTLPEDKTYDQIVIVGGSIDLERKETTDIIADYQAMLVSSSAVSNKITVASILPRTDKDLKEKTCRTNTALKELCDKEGYNFIENDPSFFLMNGSVNDACLVSDGLHLTKRGLDSLLKNCEVTKDGSAFTPKRYPDPQKPNTLLFRGHEHPLSNFFPLQITMNGKKFKSTEAAYQYAKAEHMKDYAAARRIQKADTAVQAMFIASKIETNESWKNRKANVMESLVQQKIAVSSKVRSILADSAAKQIVEDTAHEFWGRGQQGQGENKLGKIWMKLRQKLKDDPDFFSQPTRTLSRHTGSTAKTPSRHTRSNGSHQGRWATTNSQPHCYNCGEAGHVIKQCRQSERVSCWACGLDGHKQKHCDYLPDRSGHYNRYDRDGYDGHDRYDDCGRYDY